MNNNHNQNKENPTNVLHAAPIGYHIIWDVYGCNPQKIERTEPCKTLLHQIVEILQLGIVEESYKQFSPVGATGVILLEESHISIHTWPEKEYAAIDVFSCKKFDLDEVNLLIQEFLETNEMNCNIIERGIL